MNGFDFEMKSDLDSIRLRIRSQFKSFGHFKRPIEIKWSAPITVGDFRIPIRSESKSNPIKIEIQSNRTIVEYIIQIEMQDCGLGANSNHLSKCANQCWRFSQSNPIQIEIQSRNGAYCCGFDSLVVLVISNWISKWNLILDSIRFYFKKATADVLYHCIYHMLFINITNETARP